MSYTTAFDQIGHDDIALAGGKGANLGELTRAGLPVPPGFVLGTPAYQDFLDANDRAAAILTLAALPVSATPADYEHASEQIRALFTGGVVPEAMATELATSYARLGEDDGGGEVAAVAEASFAGQQDTYLNIRGIPALIAAVIDCWASLWTARAMAYRAREGIDPAGVRLAVVVQRMVEADAAGVMFTANPSNGRRDQITISAAWGLGESVVSGAVSTDDLVIEARGGRVLSRRTADKQVMTVYTAHGTEERPVPEARRRQPVLDDTAAAELAGLGTRIAAHYGAPQDIEWARAGRRFAIVQARPITALPEPTAEAPTDWTVPYPNGVYFRTSIVEQLPDPLTPLFADLIDGAVTRSLTALMEQAFGAGGLREGDIRFPTVNGYAYYYRTTGLLRFLLGYDREPIRAEKSLYDLAMWTRDHPALAEELLSGHRPSDAQWNTRFQNHLDWHGHVIYNWPGRRSAGCWPSWAGD